MKKDWSLSNGMICESYVNLNDVDELDEASLTIKDSRAEILNTSRHIN